MIIFSAMALVGCQSSSAAGNTPVESDRTDVVQHYGGLGEHRSGTAADLETSQWLRSELEHRGVKAELQHWPLKVFELKSTRLLVGGSRFDVFPFWYPAATGSDGVSAPLVAYQPCHDEAKSPHIALLHPDTGPIQVNYDPAPLLQQAANCGAIAAVVVLDHPERTVAAQNAHRPHNQLALPLPAVIAGQVDAAQLQARAEVQSQAQLIIDGASAQGQAANVIGHVGGHAAKWVIVTTPTSGWFTATNERGPGIAMWLALASWASRNQLPVNFLFVALSGHELGGMGVDALIESGRLPPPDQVSVWLHLGSGIAANAPLLAAVSSRSDLEAAVSSTLVRAASLSYVPEAETPRGSEQYRALQLGYPVVGLFGADRRIHTRLDSQADVSDQGFSNVLAGLKDMIGQLARSGDEKK